MRIVTNGMPCVGGRGRINLADSLSFPLGLLSEARVAHRWHCHKRREITQDLLSPRNDVAVRRSVGLVH